LAKYLLLLTAVFLFWLAMRVFRFAMRLVVLAVAFLLFGTFYYLYVKKRSKT